MSHVAPQTGCDRYEAEYRRNRYARDKPLNDIRIPQGGKLEPS